MPLTAQHCETPGMDTTDARLRVLASGDKIVVRDRIPSDVDSYVYWQTHGGWRRCDAPWEDIGYSMTPEEEAELRERFLETCGQEPPVPRRLAAIATRDGKPLGWVNRYANREEPDEWYVGVGIGEDEYLNQGIGTEALRLWVDYLFANSDVHRIGLTTWSFNPRMMHVAKKLGFLREGVQREVREWQGERLDRVQYGMLRREWEEKRTGAR